MVECKGGRDLRVIFAAWAVKRRLGGLQNRSYHRQILRTARKSTAFCYEIPALSTNGSGTGGGD